jgi:hypothetical protein
MEFLSQNLIDTTTMFTVDSGTGTLEYLFDRNLNIQYQTDGYTGNTSTIITVTFGAPTAISRILLQNHNLKQFRIFYDGATASVFSPDANITANSDTYHYFAFATKTASSISLQMDSTIDAGEEREIGQFYVGDAQVEFDYNPHTDNFDPKLYKQKIKHTMPDGGTNLFIVGNKFQANITLKFAGETFRDALRDVYDTGKPIYFIPESTNTGWAGEAHEVVWTNDWDFTYAENSRTQGYNGKITIEETPNS